MIEYYSPHKRIFLKAIAILVVVSFIWYDIAWAADLLYYNPMVKTANANSTASSSPPCAHPR